MPNELDPKSPVPENNPLDPIARHNARRYALQAMYQWQLAAAPLADIESEFIQYNIDRKIDLSYFKELIHGIPQQQGPIDQVMQQFLGRSLRDIDAVELAVLRIAIFELIFRLDVPYRVIINEALQLCKKFGSIDGYKFVNGILDKIAKANRAAEISMFIDKNSVQPKKSG